MVETTSLRKKRIFQVLATHVTSWHLIMLIANTVLVFLMCVEETSSLLSMTKVRIFFFAPILKNHHGEEPVPGFFSFTSNFQQHLWPFRPPSTPKQPKQWTQDVSSHLPGKIEAPKQETMLSCQDLATWPVCLAQPRQFFCYCWTNWPSEGDDYRLWPEIVPSPATGHSAKIIESNCEYQSPLQYLHTHSDFALWSAIFQALRLFQSTI